MPSQPSLALLPWRPCLLAGFPVQVAGSMADCFEKEIKQLHGETLPNKRGIAQGDALSSSLFSTAVIPVLRAGKAARPII